jgi:hypothetical protein
VIIIRTSEPRKGWAEACNSAVAPSDDTGSPVMLLDPRPGSLMGLSPVMAPALEESSGSAPVRAAPSSADGGVTLVGVSDSKLEIQMLHDRVMVRLVGEEGERRRRR